MKTTLSIIDAAPSPTGQAMVICTMPPEPQMAGDTSTPPPLFGCWHGKDTDHRGALWATCDRPGRLSEVAFGLGALSVRHDYDLAAEHRRFHHG